MESYLSYIGITTHARAEVRDEMLKGLRLRLKYWKKAKEGNPVIFLECHAYNFEGADCFIEKVEKAMMEWQHEINNVVKLDALIFLVSRSR